MNDELTASIPERVAALEVGHEVQEQMLVAIQAELIESDRLINSVGRLAEGSDALAAALLKVDATAQATSRLGRELQQVKEDHSTTEEIEDKVAKAKEEAARLASEKAEQERRDRRTLAKRVVVALIFVVIFLFSLVLYVSDAAHDACQNRQEASKAVRDTLVDFKNPANAELVDAGVARINQTLSRTCDQQYRLHL